jgi:phosphatidylglycerophosphate synthase
MIETNLRHHYQKLCIDPLLRSPLLRTTHPIAITITSGIIGICVMPLLAFDYPLLALIFLFLSGFFDTLDGSLARHQRKTSQQGAALDIVSDRIVECAILFGLFFVAPESRTLPTFLMLASIFICVTSFLIVGLFTDNHSEKSFHYSPGLIERAEAFIFWGLMILFPSTFHALSYAFSILVLTTATIRMRQFLKNK